MIKEIYLLIKYTTQQARKNSNKIINLHFYLKQHTGLYQHSKFLIENIL